MGVGENYTDFNGIVAVIVIAHIVRVCIHTTFIQNFTLAVRMG